MLQHPASRRSHTGQMARLSAYVQASHPEPTLAVTSLTTVLALSAGAGPSALVLGLAVLAGQLSVGWSNDWLDADRDTAVGRPDKPVTRGAVTPRALRSAAVAAAAVCLPLSALLGWRAGGLHVVAVAGAWAYNLRLKATAWSWLPYAFAFAALPSVVTLTLPGHPLAPPWATGAGLLLGIGAHLANALPDLQDDLAAGVRGLPHRLGARLSAGLSAALLLGATGCLVFGPGSPGPVRLGALGAAAAGCGLGLLRSTRPGSRASFRAVLLVAAVDVALLLASGSSLASP